MAALSKVFRKASLSLIPEATILTTSKVCCVQYLLVFRLVSGYTDEKADPGLETERLDIASFVIGSNKSLASQSGF